MSSSVSLFIHALAFAAEKHKNQRRKDSGYPYINHPIQLVEVLSQEGQIHDVDVWCVALLHDTIEDTATTHTELVEHFGQTIADLVLELTDDKSLPKATRKQLQIQNAPHKSHKAKLVGLADKICNLRDLLLHPPKDWSQQRLREYAVWAQQVIVGMTGTHLGLECLCSNLIEQGLQQWTDSARKEI